ncbi:MAG TPA: 2,3-bisphosphoglycerate-independent phosphoglycerate mutase, partial [Bacteroidetes bacterium]|nr:2,3-bisphosphoglycerate-independent phosphoglycerate mutase [Bacteroidota bacterium]
MICDGWGKGQNPEVDAIAQGDTPFYDYLLKEYPNSELKTYGKYVGLPDGQMGNSEVGHMNIGAGRIVYQDLVKINNAIKSGELEKNPEIVKLISYSKENNKPVHLMGLLSDGGVHSHIDHLFSLIDIFNKNNIPVFIHAFMDGRDTDPKSGINYMQSLMDYIQNMPAVKIA